VPTLSHFIFGVPLGVVVFLVAMAFFPGRASAADLKVMKTGLGSGTVTSGAATNCGADCGQAYGTAVTVTLTASASAGSTFSGWAGDCAGTGTCTVTMIGDRSVRAEFDLTPAIPTITDFTPEGIASYLTANSTVDSPARFIAALPREYKQNWILMSRSESLQIGTAQSPRLLLPSRMPKVDLREVFSSGRTFSTAENPAQLLTSRLSSGLINPNALCAQDQMDTKDVLTIVGWPVSCLLSVLAGGWLIPRFTKKEKVLVWAVVSESELIAKDLRDELSLPVSIQIGGIVRGSLSLVTIRLGNAGNEVIEKIEPVISVNNGASIVYIKPRGNLGEFQKCIEGKLTEGRAQVSFTHINPGSAYEFDLLLSDYELGSVVVDLAAPGVNLSRRDPSLWELPTSALRTLGVSFMGVKYDPQVTFMAEIASELKAMRKMMQQGQEGKPTQN